MTSNPEGGGLAGALDELSGSTATELDLAGVVITVMAADSAEAVVGSSGETVRGWEQLQLDVGEGPSRSAFATGRPEMVVDLDRDVELERWPGYVMLARRAGIRAVNAFPLQLGASRLGALTVYDSRPGHLTGAALRVCLTSADRATELLLEREPGWSADADHPGSGDVFQLRNEVFQAQGMVMVQLGCSLAEALARLRGHAYAADRDLTEVAVEVIAGRTTLGPDVPVARPPP